MGRKFKKPPLRIDREYCGFKIVAGSWQELADAKERIDSFVKGHERRTASSRYYGAEPVSRDCDSPNLFEVDKPI